MTTMAAMPIYVKNPSKNFFSRTTGPILYKTWHLGLQPIIVCSNDDPGLTLTYLTARSNYGTLTFLQEKVKPVDVVEFIAACDLNIVRCKQLDE